VCGAVSLFMWWGTEDPAVAGGQFPFFLPYVYVIQTGSDLFYEFEMLA